VNKHRKISNKSSEEVILRDPLKLKKKVCKSP